MVSGLFSFLALPFSFLAIAANVGVIHAFKDDNIYGWERHQEVGTIRVDKC